MTTMFWKMPAIALTAFALCTAAVSGENAHGDHDHDDSPLAEAMDEMAGAFKKLAQALVGELNEARKQGHQDFKKPDDD